MREREEREVIDDASKREKAKKFELINAVAAARNKTIEHFFSVNLSFSLTSFVDI